jgi:hypothetical protein
VLLEGAFHALAVSYIRVAMGRLGAVPVSVATINAIPVAADLSRLAVGIHKALNAVSCRLVADERGSAIDGLLAELDAFIVAAGQFPVTRLVLVAFYATAVRAECRVAEERGRAVPVVAAADGAAVVDAQLSHITRAVLNALHARTAGFFAEQTEWLAFFVVGAFYDNAAVAASAAVASRISLPGVAGASVRNRSSILSAVV